MRLPAHNGCRGTVADDPDVRATSVRVTVAVITVNTAIAGEGVSCCAARHGTAYGDRVSVRGVLEEPQALKHRPAASSTIGYLRARGISLIMQRAVLRETEEEPQRTSRALRA